MHILARGEGVKAEVCVDLVSVVEGAVVVVDSVSCVAVFLQVKCQRLAGGAAKHRLIGVFRGTEQLDVDSREHLELGVDGARADRGHVKVTVGVFFL